MFRSGIKYSRDTRGVAALEFAIISPVLMMFVFGIIAYGIFFGAAHSVQQLAADSARIAIGGLNEEERQKLVSDYVSSAVPRAGLLASDHLEVVIEDVEGDADSILVSVSYDASELPIWNIYAGLPIPEKTITRQSLIRLGGY